MAKKSKAGKINISLKDISQDIDLEKYLKRKPTTKDKREFADKSADVIENRSLDTKNINGRKFTKYSESYAKKKGVTRDSVDMFLDGDMLGSISRNARNEKPNSVNIAVKGDLNIKKAHNHMTNKSKKNPLPKRSFFGLTDDEARKIAKTMKPTKSKGTSLKDLTNALALLDTEMVE